MPFAQFAQALSRAREERIAALAVQHFHTSTGGVIQLPEYDSQRRVVVDKAGRPKMVPAQSVADSQGLNAIGPTRLCVEFVEQRPGVLQIGGVEALSERSIDAGEHVARLIAPAGLVE